MVWNDKVVWQEGMFLRSQHFQQADRHAEHLVQMRAAPLRPHPWECHGLGARPRPTGGGQVRHRLLRRHHGGRHAFAVPGDADQPPPLDLPERLPQLHRLFGAAGAPAEGRRGDYRGRAGRADGALWPAQLRSL